MSLKEIFLEIAMSKTNQRMFGIDIRNFSRGKKICSGGFGDVFYTQYLKTNENFAAKVIKRDPSKPQSQKLIENELNIMMNVHHPTIIKFLGYSYLDFNMANNTTIFMELAKNLSLDNILEKTQKSETPKGYDNTIRQIILIGVACGMKYLHENNIIHRDLKSNNILLDENLHPLITDFGTAKYFNKKLPLEQPQQICGTLPYMAPEMITGTKYNQKIDVYSFGILMYEVLTDTEPYPHLEKKDSIINEFKKRVVRYNYRPEFKVQVKSQLKNLIEKCWSPSPNERPNFDELFEKLKDAEYFLDDVDAKKVQNYVNSITKNENLNEKPKKERLGLRENDNNYYRRLNDQLKMDNANLKEQIYSLREENKQLTNNYQQLSKKYEEVVKKLSVYENENKEANSPDDSIHPVIVYPPNNKKNEDTNPRNQPKLFNIRQNRFEEKYISPKNSPTNSPRSSPLNDEYSSPRNSSRTPQRPYHVPARDKKDDMQFIRTPQRPATSRDKREDMFMRSQIIRDKRDDNLFIKNPIKRSPIQSGEKREEDLFAKSQIIKEKRDDDVVNKASVRVSSLPNEKTDEESLLKKLPPLRKTKSDETTSKSLSFIISVAEFNSYPLQLQRSFVSKVNANSRGRSNQFFKNLDSLLLYLLQFVSTSEASNYIEIQSENPDITLDNIKESNCVNLLSNATEILYINKTLDSEEFMNILDLFEQISIEIKYLSKFFMGSYRIISALTNDQIKPNIFISGVKRTDNTFKGDEFINSVKLDNSVTTIGDYAFKGCLSLTNIIIPPSVTSIGSGCFEGCVSLIEISIPSSVPSIGFGLFKGCSSLEKITLLDSIKLIRSSAFSGCSALNQITIPSSVTSIGDHAFEGCTSLEQITIPSSVISIGEFAFANCKSLTRIEIPISVIQVGKNAFEKCTSLKEISIPNTLSNQNEIGIPMNVKITYSST